MVRSLRPAAATLKPAATSIRKQSNEPAPFRRLAPRLSGVCRHANQVHEIHTIRTHIKYTSNPPLKFSNAGFGVEQLRDNCMDTYWQSDGQLPHLVNIQFQRKTAISHIYIYTDYKLDESYTPSRISVRCGTHFNDLREIEMIDLTEPTGWVSVPVSGPQSRTLRAFMVQIAVISNHQNGRDTHMRQIKIHSPIEGRCFALEQFGQFATIDFQKYMTIR